MHQDNKDRNPHAIKETRRMEIVMRFDVPQTEATQEFLDAMVGGIKQEFLEEFGKSAEIEGKWL